jgi:hypothetical protein
VPCPLEGRLRDVGPGCVGGQSARAVIRECHLRPFCRRSTVRIPRIRPPLLANASSRSSYSSSPCPCSVRRTPGSAAKTAPSICHGAGFVSCNRLFYGCSLRASMPRPRSVKASRCWLTPVQGATTGYGADATPAPVGELAGGLRSLRPVVRGPEGRCQRLGGLPPVLEDAPPPGDAAP